jgi:acyl carrier protein
MTSLDKLRAFLVEQLGVDPATVTPEARLREDLALDSLDLAELSMHAEKHFGLTVPEEALAGLRTVADLTKVIDAASTSRS